MPVFTEEYRVLILIGTKEDMLRPTAIHVEDTVRWVRGQMADCRGRCWDTLSSLQKNPLINVDSELELPQQLAILAHEACHAADYVAQYCGIQDSNGEFRAHIVGQICRQVFPYLLK